MLNLLTRIELLVAAAFVVLASGEIVTLARARRRGLTKNRSRMVTHSAMIAVVAAVVIYGQYWKSLVSSDSFYQNIGAKPVLNWPVLLLGVAAMLLALFEVLSLWRARRAGLTDNLSRLFSHLTLFILLTALTLISVAKWDLYLNGFQPGYGSRSPVVTDTD